MENNIREIKEKCLVFSKCLDVDLDFQENLMSYNDDMLKIIRCCINNFAVSTDFKNGNLTIYGKSKIYLTYVSESTSCITTADFEEDFQKSVQIEGNYEDVTADICVIDKYCNFRIINQRRVDIHNAFALDIKAYSASPVVMVDSAESMLIRKEKITYFSHIGTSYVKADIEEEAPIPSDSEVIRKIINTFYNIQTDEIKIIKDKMLVKLKIDFSFLYTTDTDNEIINKCEKAFNLSRIVDISGIDEDDHAVVNAGIGNLYVKPKADGNNELRLIEIIGDINISSTVFRQNETELSTDSYSPEKESENTFGKIMLNTDGNIINDSISDTVLFEFENINIVEVLDLSLSVQDGKSIELNAFIMNEKSEVLFISQRKDITVIESRVRSLYVKAFDYVIKSASSISVRYSIEFCGIQFTESSFNILSDVNITDKAVADSPALVVYFAKEQERLWDIAKKFRTSVDLIKKENELNEDVLDTRRVLLIPGM